MVHLLPEGGDGLQIWAVAENTVNKQMQTAENRQPSSMGVLKYHSKTFFKKIINVLKYHKAQLDHVPCYR
jgi:hypothetical protein